MHHSQYNILEAIRIYSPASTITHQQYSTSSTLTHEYKFVKCLALIITSELIMETYSDLLTVTYLEINLEMEIETQVNLLEEMIWVIQLAPLTGLYYWKVIIMGVLLLQN